MKKIILTFAYLLSVSPHLSYASNNGYQLLTTHYLQDKIFIQGLEQTSPNQLLYSSGRYGQSEIGYLNLTNGQKEKVKRLNPKIFGEGTTVTPYGIWQISWRENLAFLRDLDSLDIKQVTQFPGEGWGLAYDNKNHQLWLSNGSAVLQKFHPESFEKLGELPVWDQQGSIDKLNELEFANGFLYANVWMSSQILKIDPDTGQILSKYDLSNLVNPLGLTDKNSVLNGIAHIQDQRFYVTGKNFGLIWEIELSDIKQELSY